MATGLSTREEAGLLCRLRPSTQRPRPVFDAPALGRCVPFPGGGQMTRESGHRFCRPWGPASSWRPARAAGRGHASRRDPLCAQGY